jgi:seryl-tRNA(Sec) selenium transferase
MIKKKKQTNKALKKKTKKVMKVHKKKVITKKAIKK